VVTSPNASFISIIGNTIPGARSRLSRKAQMRID
jgi:hypothetical protein